MKLPDGWKIIKLNDVAVPLRRRNTIGNRNVLTSSAQFGLINQMEYHNRSMAGENLSLYYLLYKGDFAYNRSSAKEYPFGAIRRLDKYDTGIVSSLYIPFTLKKDSCCSDFLAYLLDSDVINQYLYQVCQEGARNHGLLNIAKEDFFQMPLCLPNCTNEQRRIAEFLGTWDKAIEKLERLIAAKEKQFKSLMQGLLTPQHHWTSHVLKDLGYAYGGLSDKKADDFGHGYQYIPYLNIFTNYFVDIEDMGNVSIKDNEYQNEVKYGDIFFTISSETPDEVGMCSVLLSNLKNTYLNSFSFGFRLNNFDILLPEFAAYYFRGNYFRRLLKTLAQGATRYNLSKNSFMLSRIVIPNNLHKQKEIAAILSSAQNKLGLLKKELAALEKQKRGLMQKLLTGTWRV